MFGRQLGGADDGERLGTLLTPPTTRRSPMHGSKIRSLKTG